MSMSNVNSAKVYRDMDRFIDRIFPLVEGFPRDKKVILGDRILNYCLDTSSYIHIAYTFIDNKKVNIEQAIFNFQKVISLLRHAHDWKIISNKQHASLFKDITDIKDQLIKWRNKYVKLTGNTSESSEI